MSGDQAPVDLPIHPLAPTNPQRSGATPSRARFNGFVGPSDVADHVRIYADLTFTSFYDIRRGDIISANQVDEVDPESPTSVLVDGGAQVIFIRADRVEGAADYLVGAIRRDYLDESVLFSDDGGDHPTTFACATDPPKCTGPIFCPPKYERAF